METMVFYLRYFRNDPNAYFVLNKTAPGTRRRPERKDRP